MEQLLNRIFPTADVLNYAGGRPALWVFYIITVGTIGRSLIHMFSADGGAQSIATIPLDRYAPESASTVILIFSYWGISQFLMGLVMLVVALRYRGIIPLMYLFLFMEYGLRLILGQMNPIETEGTAPGSIGNMVLTPVFLILFIWSLGRKQKDLER